MLLLFRGRVRGYVVAVADVVHTANLGHRNSFAIDLKSNGITRVKRGSADIRIRYLGGEQFEVEDVRRKQEVTAGSPTRVVDGRGNTHELVLWAFATPSAAAEASRR